MKTREASLGLLHAMSLPGVPARKAAASGLASLRTPEAVATLRHAAEFDDNPQVRQVAAVLLGQ